MGKTAETWFQRNWQGLLSGGILSACIGIAGSAVIAYVQTKATAPVLPSEEQAVSSTYLGQLEQKLRAANIYLAGDNAREPQIRTYLHDDPGLLGVAETCVKTMGRRKLRQPLHLDVIYGKYKFIALGKDSPKGLPPKLSHNTSTANEAMKDNWNEMYPDKRVTSLDEATS